MFSSRSRSSVRLKDPKQREEVNAGGGGVSGGAFTRWLREFRRETYKVNVTATGNGCNGGGTYHTTAEDSRRRHSFNAHDKSAVHLQHQVVHVPDGEPNLAQASRATCRRANSTVVQKSRTRNDGPFAKANNNCSTAVIRELSSSKENHRRSNSGDLDRHKIVTKSGQTTTSGRMTETCDGHTPRHRAPLPPAEVDESSSGGHEKFPSWPVAAASATIKSNGMPATAARKSWAEEQTAATGYQKEQPPSVVRPYPKRLSNGLYTQQLKTVMERCEKGGKPEPLDRDRSTRPKGGYAERLQIGEKGFCVPLTTSAATTDPADPLKAIQLTQAQLEKYSRAYDDSPHRETDEYSSCFDGSDSALSSHLTKEELEHYTRIYEEKSSSQISLSGKVAPSHQHQTSYAQSEGYHSYVSSTDSTSTPFLDRLRRENESVAVSAQSGKDQETKPSGPQGRDSSASSGSSSETLKWHGSNSDLSTVSSAGGGHRATAQLIAHSAKVSAPQRHHSESVSTVEGGGWPALPQDAPGSRNSASNQRNLRKLFPVSTYTVQPAVIVQDEKTSPKSPPALTVAERISELEKQQQQQQQQSNNKFAYFDPEKKHKVPDHSLRAIQKRALLSFYERHQPGSAWRSEPQLSPPPRPPPLPSRPRLPTPLSRRSSVSSEYDTPVTWNDVDCTKDDSSADDVNNVNSKELNKNQHRSSSCGSLSTALLGPMVLGPSISIDDWVPELPPKKKQTAQATGQQQQQQKVAAKREPSPDLPPPPPPEVDDDEQLFASDEPLPPPPPPDAIWPKPDALVHQLLDRSYPPRQRAAAMEKRLECSFSAVEDALACTATGGSPLFPGGKSRGDHQQRRQPHGGHRHGQSEKSKPSLSYAPPFDGRDDNKTGAAAASAGSDQQRPADRVEPRPNHKSEFGRSSSVRRSKLTIPNKDYCRTEFSARKSVFQPAPKQQQQQQQVVVLSAVKPPAFSAATSVVQNVNVVKHQICTPLRMARDAEKKAAAAAKSPVKSPAKSVVGPIKTSGVFPPSLEPSCPPTLYQRSQSKASYLSAYKREPREREKGLPNFEGSYKRTASPNSDGRGGGVEVAAAIEPQDVENVAPDGSDVCSNVSDTSGGGRLQENVNNNNNSTTSQQQPLQQQHPPSSSPSKQPSAEPTTTLAPSPAVLSERPTVEQQQQQQQPQQSKTLPRVNNSAGQDFKRSSRAPRTQSDPSNMPNKADASIACTLQMMMMPPSRHSESVSSLQKRSQSDLSQVGSTESGYSSLSLNAPSPSHSPTRLSSGDFGGPPPPAVSHHQHLHHQPLPQQLQHHNSGTAVGPVDAPTAAGADGNQQSSPAEPQSAAAPVWRLPVSRICSTVSSDAASQMDVSVKQQQQQQQPGGGCDAPPAARRKSPEEIECEELSRDLISHLSPSDKLLNILAPGPDVKRSTDYVSPLFRMDLAPRSRTSIAEKLLDSAGANGVDHHNDVVSCASNNGLSPNSSYYTTSEPKAKLLNHFSRQRLPVQQECNGIGTLQKKKADLVSRLDSKLKVLRDEQIALAEEAAVNEALGVLVADRVKAVAKTQEANKFRTHVQEVGHITSLLLSLSGRLARAENALLGLVVDHPEKKALEEKKSKLTCQLEEAKELKDNIDRRGEFVSTTLSRYLSEDEYSDYDHFIAMKAKLLIDAREIADKIQLGEEQLRALKETLEDY